MLSVRIADLSDIDSMSAVLAASWKSAYRGLVDDAYLDALREDHWVDFLTLGLKRNSMFAMVLESSREIIGAAILAKTDQAGEAGLIAFYLLPERIGQGNGHLFYGEIETELKRRGFLHCALDVLVGNERAIKFYSAHGFTPTSKEVGATLGGREYICKVMKKTL